MDHENEGVIRRAYDAIAAGDAPGFLAALDENVVWHETTKGMAGDYHGPDEVAALFGRLMQQLDGPMSMRVHDILVSDEHAVVLHETTFSRSGRTASMKYADVYHVRNGKITEHWHLAVDPHADDEFWS
jgi:ketosteroid isomerase-like protein